MGFCCSPAGRRASCTYHCPTAMTPYLLVGSVRTVLLMISEASPALETSRAPLLLPLLPWPQPHIGTEVVMAGYPSIVFHLQVADGYDGSLAEWADGSHSNGSPALGAGVGECIPAQDHASRVFWHAVVRT